MLRAGYGNAKDDEWIDNADLEDPKYYSVSVTNTFKRAVDIYNTSMDIIDYYSEKYAPERTGRRLKARLPLFS